LVLVDTSVWIDHLRVGDRKLVPLLEDGEVGVHPLVIGELACGNWQNRREILALLAVLPSVGRVSDEEVLFFIERHRSLGIRTRADRLAPLHQQRMRYILNSGMSSAMRGSVTLLQIPGSAFG
jgi:predicted nucleic acid-binding protein